MRSQHAKHWSQREFSLPDKTQKYLKNLKVHSTNLEAFAFTVRPKPIVKAPHTPADKDNNNVRSI
jgi:hypothetical protein